MPSYQPVVTIGQAFFLRKEQKMFTMLQVCEKTGMTYQTLKYYCNEGLVPEVKRDRLNRRVFDEHDLKWIQSLSCLKKCGMSIQEMKEYLALCLQGESTIPQRKVILAWKREALLDHIDMLNACVDYIDWKQGYYDDVLSGKQRYVSNLTRHYSNGTVSQSE